MPKIVVKFGGSNLRSKEEILRIIQVVKNYQQPVIAVVSAFYGVTNYLVETLENARKDETAGERATTHLRQLKEDILIQMIDDQALLNSTMSCLEEQLSELKNLLRGIALTGDASAALEDHVLAFGERLSSIFLNGVFNAHGIVSKTAFPENIGLQTDGEFGNATVDFHAATAKVREALGDENV